MYNFKKKENEYISQRFKLDYYISNTKLISNSLITIHLLVLNTFQAKIQMKIYLYRNYDFTNKVYGSSFAICSQVSSHSVCIKSVVSKSSSKQSHLYTHQKKIMIFRSCLIP